jgi:hypothetical protein
MLAARGSIAQPVVCAPHSLHRVNATLVNVVEDPENHAIFVDVLRGGDIVCIDRKTLFGSREWGHLLFKVEPISEQRTRINGWVLMQYLFDMRMGIASPGNTVEFEDIVRFDQPVPFGPVPVKGRSLQELTNSTPMFPSVGEAENALWERKCPTCHKWDRQMLCKQGETYLGNPRNALHTPHPFGGAFKVALMRWAKNGCQ